MISFWLKGQNACMHWALQTLLIEIYSGFKLVTSVMTSLSKIIYLCFSTIDTRLSKILSEYLISSHYAQYSSI